MSVMKLVSTLVIFFVLSALFTHLGQTHPGDGIAINSNGVIYFTDVARKTLWKIDANGKLQKVISNRWAHGLSIDSMDRVWLEVEVNNTQYSIVRVDTKGRERQVMKPMERGLGFYGVNILVDLDGSIYFPHSNPPHHFATGIRIRDLNGKTKLIAGSQHYGHRDGFGSHAQFSGINSMCFGPKGHIYVVDQDSIRKVYRDGKVETIFKDIKLQDPKNQPFDNGNPSVSNRLYGLAVDKNENVYVAYHGDRCVLKLSPEGRNVIYQSEKPWSPVGVALLGKDLVIKESGLEPESSMKGPRIQILKKDGTIDTLVKVHD